MNEMGDIWTEIDAVGRQSSVSWEIFFFNQIVAGCNLIDANKNNTKESR